jgi:hypothetical protein
MLYKFRLHQLYSTVCKHVAGPSISEADDVLTIDQRIRFEELKWDERYRLDSRSKTLQLRDQAHWNILHCYANQLRLLLYRPLLHVGRRSPIFNSETVEKCASSSMAILGSYRMFCESPLFRRYSWFANGLCSFFALHAASTLAACLLQRGQFSGMDQARDIFNRTTLLFRDRKDRSAICEKSLPVLLILQCVLTFDDCLHYKMHTDQTPRTKRRQIAPPVLDSLQPYAKLPVDLQSHDLDIPVDDAVSGTFEAWLQDENWSNSQSIQWVGHANGTLCIIH